MDLYRMRQLAEADALDFDPQSQDVAVVAVERLNELQGHLQREAQRLSGTPNWTSFGAAVVYGHGRMARLELMANHTEGSIVTMDRISLLLKGYKGTAVNPVYDLQIEMSRLVRDLKHGQKADQEKSDRKHAGDVTLEKLGPGSLLTPTRQFWKGAKGLQPKMESHDMDMDQQRKLAGIVHTRPGLGESMVGQTILQQMGGPGRLRAMIGAKDFVTSDNSVTFKWPARERSKGNTVTITLHNDLYDMEFFNGTKSVKKIDGLYDDQLVGAFERQTGLYLSLGKSHTPSGSGRKPGPEMPPIGTKHEAASSAQLKKAAEYGTAAFHAGVKHAPSLDKQLMALLKGQPVGADASALMKSWMKAWTQASLTNPVEGKLGELAALLDGQEGEFSSDCGCETTAIEDLVSELRGAVAEDGGDGGGAGGAGAGAGPAGAAGGATGADSGASPPAAPSAPPACCDHCGVPRPMTAHFVGGIPLWRCAHCGHKHKKKHKREDVSEASKTYKQSHDEIMTGLEQHGWKVKKDLKVPHATSPTGAHKLYFKKQSVHLTHGGGDLHAARSIWSPDTRGSDLDSFAQHLGKWTGKDLKDNPLPKAKAPEHQLNPDQYHQKHDECPEGYHFDSESKKCVKKASESYKPGTVRKRKGGDYVKQHDGSWVAKSQTRGANKEVDHMMAATDLLNKHKPGEYSKMGADDEKAIVHHLSKVDRDTIASTHHELQKSIDAGGASDDDKHLAKLHKAALDKQDKGEAANGPAMQGVKEALRLAGVDRYFDRQLSNSGQMSSGLEDLVAQMKHYARDGHPEWSLKKTDEEQTDEKYDSGADTWNPGDDKPDPTHQHRLQKSQPPGNKPADKNAQLLKALHCPPGKEPRVVYGKPSCVAPTK